jgi:D-glycero-D-manno-heptose 1,7-bisphosphate phosphatase
VFLDRDGVLNRAFVRDGKPYPPSTVADVDILPGVPEALRRLEAAGFVLIVVSNQPDVARGTTSKATVESINGVLGSALPIDRFIMCYHDSADGCGCRKPLPGMLVTAANDLDIDLPSSYMVGDRWRDMEAGLAAGCRTIFVDYRYEEKRPEVYDYAVSSLSDAASVILSVNHTQ